MSILQWIPLSWHPFVSFLLMIGLLSVGYTWVFTTVSSLLGKFDRPVRVTIGHPLLTALTILTIVATVVTDPGMMLFTACTAVVFLWITMAPELYEEYGGTLTTRSPESRMLFVIQFALILVWVTIAILSFDDNARLIFERMTELSLTSLSVQTTDIMRMLLSLPWYSGVALGAFGTYSLFRCLFQALFATFGRFGELPALFRKRPDAEPLLP